MILLSKKKILLNIKLLYDFLNFWNTLANAFCLSLSMMVPTLHDVVAITSLLMYGDKAPFLHDVLSIDLDFQVNKKNNVYSTFINTFNRESGLVGETEHRAFLLF